MLSNLLERESALATLYAALGENSSAHGALVLVQGEAGLGKTALVTHFAAQLDARLPIWWGACDHLFTPRPWGPWHDIARQADGHLAKALAGHLDRSAIFDAALALVQRRQILILEDLHWADESSLDLLKFLGRRIDRAETLLIATFRDDELGQQHPLRFLLGDLATSPALYRIALQPLTAAAVQQMAASTGEEAKRLHSLTAGNPFYLQAILAAERDRLPPSIHDAIMAKLARLSSQARLVINASAVIGTQIEPRLLADITGSSAGAVEENLSLGLLHSDDDRFKFRHELVRQTVLAELPSHRSLYWHQVILATLERWPTGQVTAERMLGHAVPAGHAPAIVKYATIAAQAAEQAGMNPTAARLYNLALEHYHDLPLSEQVELHRRYGLSMRDQPGLVAALQSWQKGVALARAGGDPALLAKIMTQLANGYLVTDQHDKAIPLLEETLALLESAGQTDELAAAQRSVAYSHLTQGRGEKALAAARLSYAASLQSDSIIVQLRGRQILGFCLHIEDSDAALDTMRQGYAQAYANPVPHGVELFSPNLAMFLFDRYLLDEAEAVLRQDYQYALNRDMERTLRMVESWRLAGPLYRGDWERCAALGARFVNEEALLAGGRNAAVSMMVRLWARQGDLARARQLCEAADAAGVRETTVPRRGHVVTIAAELAWLEGDRDRLHAEIDSFLPLALANKQTGFAAELAYWAWKSGRPVDTAAWMLQPFVLQMEGRWRSAAQAWAALGCPYEQARALAEGDVPALREALAIFEQLGAKPMVDNTRAALRSAGVAISYQRKRRSTLANPFGLTTRQVEILALLTEGLTNAAIAHRLHISPKTVDHHVSAILGTLHVSSRTAAADKARQHPHFQ